MRACLDACVIYPTILREILLGFAAKGLFEPVFSERILEEWTRATAKIGPEAQAQARVEAVLVRANFPKAMVREQPRIEARLALPDANDLHVLAVAIAAHADCIVTFNAQDFPRAVLAEHGIDRRDPDGFLWELTCRHPDEARAVIADVLATAERMSGQAIGAKKLLKKAQLNRLAKLVADPIP
jgi:predicted nucleic acid-binding protein